MKFIAEIDSLYQSRSGEGVLILKIPNIKYLQELESMKRDAVYSVEIKEKKPSRSINQNKMMWEIIHQIDIARNGYRSNDEWNIYIEALERAGAKCYYIQAYAEAEEGLKSSFRAIQLLEKKGIYNVYKVFAGSSKMDTKEMTELIDTVLDMASECGIVTDYYKELLK